MVEAVVSRFPSPQKAAFGRRLLHKNADAKRRLCEASGGEGSGVGGSCMRRAREDPHPARSAGHARGRRDGAPEETPVYFFNAWPMKCAEDLSQFDKIFFCLRAV